MLQDSRLAVAAATTAATALPGSSCKVYVMQGYSALGAAGNAAIQEWVLLGGGLLLGGHEWGSSGNTTGGYILCSTPMIHCICRLCTESHMQLRQMPMPVPSEALHMHTNSHPQLLARLLRLWAVSVPARWHRKCSSAAWQLMIAWP